MEISTLEGFKAFYKKIKNYLGSLSLNKKLFFLVLDTTFWVNFWLILVIFISLKLDIEKEYISSVKNQMKLLHNEVILFNNSLKFQIQKYMDIFQNLLPENFENLNKEKKAVEKFTELTGGIAAVLKYDISKKDFVRVAYSSVRGGVFPIIGTHLGKDHPAYSYLIKGEPYTEKIILFGREYITRYFPIKRRGNLKWVLFVGIDVTSQIKKLTEFISELKVGARGYFFIIDRTFLNNSNNFNLADLGSIFSISSERFKDIKDILKFVKDRREGNFCYISAEKGVECEKKVFFKSYPELKWVIGAVYYESDIKHEVLRRILNFSKWSIIAVCAGQAVLLILTLIISNTVSKTIKKVTSQIKLITSEENYQVKTIDIERKDEIGELVKAVNDMIITFEELKIFKKIIEEDESVEDVYNRLGSVIEDRFKLNCIIYEISTVKKRVKRVYPLEEMELPCSVETFVNSDLCRVKRTGHTVSSILDDRICKYFVISQDYYYHCLPIKISGQVGGVVQIFVRKREVEDVEELERKIKKINQYIKEAEPVIESKRLMRVLKESALRDPLTGLYNRRFLEENYGHIIAGVLRRESALGILMCDIDYFKYTNDTYGHDAGDRVLKALGETLRKSVRASDVVLRWGGEEFLVLLVDVKLGDSEKVAEKIRKKVEALKVQVTGAVIKKTISIGVSEFPKDSDDFWETIKFADLALYKAKELGRNTVVRFKPELLKEYEEKFEIKH